MPGSVTDVRDRLLENMELKVTEAWVFGGVLHLGVYVRRAGAGEKPQIALFKVLRRLRLSSPKEVSFEMSGLPVDIGSPASVVACAFSLAPKKMKLSIPVPFLGRSKLVVIFVLVLVSYRRFNASSKCDPPS